MSWDNCNEWHIDHIIPKAAFNYEKPEDIDFKKCWALKNLQPLWAKENHEKKDKLLKPFQPSLQI
jgi:5-methylcytosine-specific restriction endonuclease McrA